MIEVLHLLALSSYLFYRLGGCGALIDRHDLGGHDAASRVLVVSQEVFDLPSIVHQLEDGVGAIGWEFGNEVCRVVHRQLFDYVGGMLIGKRLEHFGRPLLRLHFGQGPRDQLRRQLPDQSHPEFVIQRSKRVRQIGGVNLLGLRAESLHVFRLS